MEVFLLFPHQLFKNPLPVNTNTPIYLIEQALFFTQYRFHKQKIILHRSSMKYYEQHLLSQGFFVTYVEHHQPASSIQALIELLAEKQTTHIHLYFPNDNWLQKQLEKGCNKSGIGFTYLPSPNFINNLP